MAGIINDAGLALMCSIGYQTGIFDTMSTMPPATSEQIAATAGLNERYVRKWLGALVTGLIVEYDPAGGLYTLPPEHAAALTRAAGPNSLAYQAQSIPHAGSGRSRHRGELPPWRRRLIRAVPALPAPAG
jgi:hypothetical protein